jgi:2-methylisocitrate lyase-like PEP mutase family enzyme
MGVATRAFRELLEGDEIIVQPAVYDPFCARVAEHVGFKALALGGYALGASMAVTEPLLSLEDVAIATRMITRVTSLPLMIDAGAGWGEPMHVMHTVRTLEHAGAASLHMEDQIYPKRAHYHRGKEHIASSEEMTDKIRAAVEARRDPDFVIVARTDAFLTSGYDAGIARAREYADAGADMIMVFPNNEDEARRVPRDLPDIPLIYLNATGHRLQRGVHAVQDLQDWGWKLVDDGSATIMVVARALRDVLTTLHETGRTQLDEPEMIGVRGYVEDVLRLEDHYAVEAATVERR